MLCTESLDDLTIRIGGSLVAVPDSFDNIDHVSTEESTSLTSSLIDCSCGKIAIVINSSDAGNLMKSLRKSRRMSAQSTNHNRPMAVNRWVEAEVLRQASSREKQLGFTHAVKYHTVDQQNDSEKEGLVALTMFGYYNVATGHPCKPEKLGNRQDTWVALKI